MKILRYIVRFLALFLLVGLFLKYFIKEESDVFIVLWFTTISLLFILGYLILHYTKKIR
jgi:lipopolysaccharide export LptBFGC system permease protein LptF